MEPKETHKQPLQKGKKGGRKKETEERRKGRERKERRRKRKRKSFHEKIIALYKVKSLNP